MFEDVSRAITIKGIPYTAKRFIHRDFLNSTWVFKFMGLAITVSDSDYRSTKDALDSAIVIRNSFISGECTESYITSMPIALVFENGKVSALGYFNDRKPNTEDLGVVATYPRHVKNNYNIAYNIGNVPPELKAKINQRELALKWLDKAMGRLAVLPLAPPSINVPINEPKAEQQCRLI